LCKRRAIRAHENIRALISDFKALEDREWLRLKNGGGLDSVFHANALAEDFFSPSVIYDDEQHAQCECSDSHG
jgi:hypothetical protein